MNVLTLFSVDVQVKLFSYKSIYIIIILDDVPVPERVKTATRQMIISHFLLVIFRNV